MAPILFFQQSRAITRALKFQQTLGTDNAYYSHKRENYSASQSGSKSQGTNTPLSDMPMAIVPPSAPRSSPRRRGSAVGDTETNNVYSSSSTRASSPSQQGTRFCERCTEAGRFSSVWRRANVTSHVIVTFGTLAIIVIGITLLQFLTLASTIKRLERTFGQAECISYGTKSRQLQLRADAPPECDELLANGGGTNFNVTSICTDLCEAVNCDEDGEMIVPRKGEKIEDEIPDSVRPYRGSEFEEYTENDDGGNEIIDQEVYDIWLKNNKPTTVSPSVPSVSIPEMTVNLMKKEGIVPGNPRVCTCTVVDGEKGDCFCHQPTRNAHNAILRVYIYMSPETVYRTNHVKTVLTRDQH